LFFAPIGRRKVLRIEEITERVDERDVMFAREAYEPGTEKYAAYYAMRPENEAVDRTIRKLPPLLASGGRYYDPERSTYIDSVFAVLEEMTGLVDGEVDSTRTDIPPEEATRTIKELVRRMSAADVGVAPLNPAYVYSHVGRGPEPWGAPIDLRHQFVIAFTLEMDYDKVEAAPDLPITEETAHRYLGAATISIALANFIRELGYPARAHIAGSNYQIMLPPVAYDAGLGELGRFGYLISPRHGARVRLGAVTTDLPLIPDEPIAFGVRDFCEKCRKCATNCPSRSIPDGPPAVVRGVEKWPLDVVSCLKYWRVIGTDCGLCMKVCPFSHPPSLLHNLVRAGIRRSGFSRMLSVYGDDLFYGRRARF